MRSGIREAEYFYCCFLRGMTDVFPAGSYALKGGVNLRLFLGSARLSEDMDFDVSGLGQSKLYSIVSRLLQAPSFTSTLSNAGITVANVTNPYSHENLMSWRAELNLPQAVRTFVRLEFTLKKALDAERSLAPLPPEFQGKYLLATRPLSYYLPESVLRGKIHALAKRKETKARDVSDLDFLFNSYPLETRQSHWEPEFIRLARDRATEVTYRDYAKEVLPYFEPEYAPGVSSGEYWESMKLRVNSKLSGLAKGVEGRGL